MQTETTPHQPVNHVFVDMENVKDIHPKGVGGKNFTFHLFFGPQNNKVEIGMVERLFENSQSVKMVRSPLTRKNALDFVLAYHLGQAVHMDPKGSFHIIAPDTGYDSLVELLKSRNVKVKKHSDWSGLHFQSPPTLAAALVSPAVAGPKVQTEPKPAAAPKVRATPTFSDAAAKLRENLKKLPKPKRPKKEKSLIAHAKPLCGKDVSEAAVSKVLGELKKGKLIAVDDKGVVTYQL